MTLGSAGRPVRRGASDPACPVRAGPRHCGQSWACSGTTAKKNTQTGRCERSMNARQPDARWASSGLLTLVTEGRNRNPRCRRKSETRKSSRTGTFFGFFYSDFFRPSDFGFRISRSVGASQRVLCGHVTQSHVTEAASGLAEGRFSVIVNSMSQNPSALNWL